MPAHHPEPVILEHPGELDQRLQSAGVDLVDPTAKVLLGRVGIVQLVEIIEPQRELVRPHRLKRLQQELIQQVLLAWGEVLRPLEPQIPGVLEQLLVLLGLLAADLVDRLGQVLAHVVAVKGDLGLRQVLQGPRQVGFRHVLADLADARHLATVGLKEAGKLLHGALIAALGHVHRAALVQIGEHRHVILPALGAGLVDPRPLDPRQILGLDRLIHVVMHHAPDPHVGLPDERAHCRHRHLLDQRHHQRLEQQREPRALPRPRHLDLLDLVLGTDHPRHPRGQVRLVLEKVQMPPRLLLGVVDWAALPAALRTREPRPLRKIDPQIQPPLLGVELHVHDLPRLLKPKRSRKQLRIVHPRLPSSRIRSRARSQPDRTASPLRTWRSPRSSPASSCKADYSPTGSPRRAHSWSCRPSA